MSARQGTKTRPTKSVGAERSTLKTLVIVCNKAKSAVARE